MATSPMVCKGAAPDPFDARLELETGARRRTGFGGHQERRP